MHDFLYFYDICFEYPSENLEYLKKILNYFILQSVHCFLLVLLQRYFWKVHKYIE